MRKTITCFILCTSFCMLSCKKDNEANPSIIGKWILKAVKYENYYKGQLKETINSKNEDSSLFIEFRADGFGISNFFTGETAEGAYKLSDDGKYVINLEDGVEVGRTEIKKLTSTELQLYAEIDVRTEFEKDAYLFTFKKSN